MQQKKGREAGGAQETADRLQSRRPRAGGMEAEGSPVTSGGGGAVPRETGGGAAWRCAGRHSSRHGHAGLGSGGSGGRAPRKACPVAVARRRGAGRRVPRKGMEGGRRRGGAAFANRRWCGSPVSCRRHDGDRRSKDPNPRAVVPC